MSSVGALVPAGAFSAATLIALGANTIVLHANGNLGPVDPQIHGRQRGLPGEEEVRIAFGSEDLAAFLTYARENVGLTDQQFLAHAFSKFCDQVGPVPIGVAARSAQLSLSMAEKLLKMHMSRGAQEQRAKTIAEKLSREFYHHGYALSRSEAREIGLPVEKSDAAVNDLIWRIWLDFVVDLDARVPFNPLTMVHANPDCAPLFGPVPSLTIPPGLPQQVVQAIVNQVVQHAVVPVPPTPYSLMHACIESPRAVSHFVTEGVILAGRQPDFQLRLSSMPYRSGWRSVEPPKRLGGAG